MRPLSDVTPKPLLQVGGRALIEWQIVRLAAAGVTEVVVNTAHLAVQLEATLGTGRELGLRIVYSREGTRAEDALETLGGIIHALPLLGDAPFIAVSGDIVTDYDYRALAQPAQRIAQGEADAHLVLVDNPSFHPQGDMGLTDGRITRTPPLLTYANIAVLAPRLFTFEPAGKRKLFPWLYTHAAAARVTGEHFHGRWFNVGTPAELDAADAALGATPLA